MSKWEIGDFDWLSPIFFSSKKMAGMEGFEPS